MFWFKVFLTDAEISQKLDIKLFSEFLNLVSALGAPVGLAMHHNPLDPIIDHNYLISTPEQYSQQLITIFHTLKYEEVMQPDLSTLKCFVGKFET